MKYYNQLDKNKLLNLYQYYKVFINERNTSSMSNREFCLRENINKGRFNSFVNVMEQRRIKGDEKFLELLELEKKWQETDKSKNQFCLENNVTVATLGQIILFVNFTDNLKLLLTQKEKDEMIFKQLFPGIRKKEDEDKPENKEEMKLSDLPAGSAGSGSSSNICKIINPDEVFKKPQDMEIIIRKGIKVIISSDLDSMTIIKIIDFIKDL